MNLKRYSIFEKRDLKTAALIFYTPFSKLAAPGGLSSYLSVSGE